MKKQIKISDKKELTQDERTKITNISYEIHEGIDYLLGLIETHSQYVFEGLAMFGTDDKVKELARKIEKKYEVQTITNEEDQK